MDKDEGLTIPEGFTPGPWGVVETFGQPLVSKLAASGIGWEGMIASVDAGDYARSRTEGLANAALIALSPQMAAEIRRQRAVIETLCGALDEALPEMGFRGSGENDTNIFYCEHCGASHEAYDDIEHAENCVIVRLRAALSTARGET